jgi:hypothetical protein
MPRLIPAIATLAATAALLYSCTLAADVTTDPSGRIVDVTLLKIESSIEGIGIALLIRGRELAFELAWRSLDAHGKDAGRTGRPSI